VAAPVAATGAPPAVASARIEPPVPKAADAIDPYARLRGEPLVPVAPVRAEPPVEALAPPADAPPPAMAEAATSASRPVPAPHPSPVRATVPAHPHASAAPPVSLPVSLPVSASRPAPDPAPVADAPQAARRTATAPAAASTPAGQPAPAAQPALAAQPPVAAPVAPRPSEPAVPAAPPRPATAAIADAPALPSPNASITVQPRPDGPEALQARASAALAAGDVQEATRLLRAALAIDPGAHTARQALLAILARGERGAAWLDALAEAAVASPERFGLLAARGLADGGRTDSALAALARVPAPLRGLEYLTTAGLLAQRAGKHGLAIDQLAEALGRSAPDSPSAPALRVAIADSLAARGDTAAAREQLEAVAAATTVRSEVRTLARERLQALPR
jgi:hypothetical protein